MSAEEDEVVRLRAQCWQMQQERDRAIEWRDSDWEKVRSLTAERDALASDRDGYVQLLTDDNNKLRAEVSELNQLFDARWSADMRAIECWRKVHPGNELVLPDHANLCLWLMEERTRLAAEVEKLNSELTDALTDLATARQDNASFMPILNRLTAEIERLKAALREIRRYSNELYATGVANAALSGDEP